MLLHGFDVEATQSIVAAQSNDQQGRLGWTLEQPLQATYGTGRG